MKSPSDTPNTVGEYASAAPQLQTSQAIDDLLVKCLKEINVTITAISRTARDTGPTRETVQNLKDCTMLLLELKKKNKEFLDGLTDEQLKALIQTNSTK